MSKTCVKKVCAVLVSTNASVQMGSVSIDAKPSQVPLVRPSKHSKAASRVGLGVMLSLAAYTSDCEQVAVKLEDNSAMHRS